MSEKTTEVTCGQHGSTHATFVCQHLVRGEGLGFNVADDPDDPRPDAWCDACDRILEEEGEWNDRSESFAGIKLPCADCYDEARRRNE